MRLAGICVRSNAASLTFAGLAGLAAIVAPVDPAYAQSGCRAPPVELAESLNEKLNFALRTGNAVELRALYAADAVLISPANPRVKDRSQDVRRYLDRLATRLRLVKHRETSFRTGCHTLVVYGDATFAGRQGSGTPQLFQMRYSRVFEERNGAWLVTLDHMSPAPDASSGQEAPTTMQRPSLSNRPTDRRARDRESLAALVKSLTPDGRPEPQVRGVTIRAPQLSAAPPVVPPQPKLASATEPANLPATEPVSRPKRQRAPRKSTGAVSWIKEVRGFNGAD